jgi:hypothetical protein
MQEDSVSTVRLRCIHLFSSNFLYIRACRHTDFGCRCNEQDLTGTILDTVASLPHKSTTTVTVTQTQTKTVRSDRPSNYIFYSFLFFCTALQVATRVRTQTATVDITSIAKITGPTIFTSVPVTTDVIFLFSFPLAGSYSILSVRSPRSSRHSLSPQSQRWKLLRRPLALA